MKKWTRPVVVEEQFTANSNVSVCYSLVCTLPGKDPYTEDGSSNSFITESKVKDRGSIHSIWGEQSFRWEEKHNSNCSLLRVIMKIQAYLKNQVVMRLRFQISRLIKHIQLQMVDILQFGQVNI